MKKIHVGKSDSAASVISKVIKAPTTGVVVYIPRGTKFSKSRNSFILLKREARAANKEVTIESVDDDVLEIAAMSGLRAINPFLGTKRRAVSDIIVIDTSDNLRDEDDGKTSKKKRRLGRKRHIKVVDKKNDIEEIKIHSGYMNEVDDVANADNEVSSEDFSDVEEEIILKPSKKRRFSRSSTGMKEETRNRKKRGGRVKKYAIFSGFSGVIIIGVFVIATALPQVTINLNFEKVQWDFVGSLDVSATIQESSFSNDKVSVRGVSLAERSTISKSYPASGSDFIETKATGVITVSNAFSSDKQGLVKTTRFETPDGKIFRMNETVTIPGAKIIDGDIIPSTIEVQVTADKAGEEYNIGATSFTIPGFEGSPKFDAFTGSSEVAMSGGFVGESKTPTEDDIVNAIEDIKSVLESASRSQLFLNLPPDLQVLDGSYKFTLIDENVDSRADSSGMFTVTARGESKLIGFQEEELLGIFRDRVEDESEVDMSIKEFSVEYGNPEVSEDGDSFTVSLSFASIWTRPFDVDKFKLSAVNLSEEALKALIFSIPGVQGGEVRFWPFWVGSVPDKIERIVVDVE